MEATLQLHSDTLCKKASNHHANHTPGNVQFLHCNHLGKHLETTGADDPTL